MNWANAEVCEFSSNFMDISHRASRVQTSAIRLLLPSSTLKKQVRHMQYYVSILISQNTCKQSPIYGYGLEYEFVECIWLLSVSILKFII